MEFILEKTDRESNARAGKIITEHGEINTPVFMPVGTAGTVKGVHQRELKDEIGSKIILCNTYHLYLRPGIKVIEEAKGIHSFANWELPVLTDSGGYQVYSLSSQRKISEQGVIFRSHIDGSLHHFTPESVIDIQRSIGSDIIMPLDECTPYPCDYEYTSQSLERTHDWLKRSIIQMNSTEAKYNYQQTLFGIVQGGVHPDLRKKSAEIISKLDLAGNAIGGLSVGEPADEMYAITQIVCDILSKDKPRYLMGVGTPENILECISSGVDMFDCVIPTRNGRNGWLYTLNGIINIKNEKWKYDYSPIDADGKTYVDQHYTKSYLRHLIVSRELLGAQIASIHNLSFYMQLTALAREQVMKGTFAQWKNKISTKLAEKI